MRTVLYIDTFSCFGHTNLNKVFLQQFRNNGIKVSVIVREGYEKDIEVPTYEVAMLIPEKYYVPHAGKIKDRISQWKILNLIRRNFSLQKYDYVFFSYFDEIVFTLSGISGNLFLLNHSNVSGFGNCIKRFFLKMVSKKGTIVVFHDTIKNEFEKHDILQVVVEPLGLSKPYLIAPSFKIGIIDERLSAKSFSLKISTLI